MAALWFGTFFAQFAEGIHSSSRIQLWMP